MKPGTQSLKSSAQGRLSRETGTLFKDAPTRVALCYPSPYHVGMSSLGFQAIYGRINATPGACAERVFLPDDVLTARASGPLCTVESQRPACEAQVFNRQLERSQRVCPSCGHHFRMSVGERIDLLLDAGSFQERDAGHR